MTPARAVALAVALAACGARPCPTGGQMLVHDESMAPPKVFAVELTIAAEGAAGRVSLRVAFHGKDAVTITVPDRADQIEWFDPETNTLVAPTPYVVWSAWRIDNAGLALESRASTAQRASRRVTLRPGETHESAVDLGAALDGLQGEGTFARGWCARAWLVGGAHPLPSNVVCWPEA